MNVRRLLPLLLSGATLSTTAAAQDPVQRPVPLPALGRTAATDADSTAIVVSPSNLVFVPAAELRWSGYFLDEEARIPSQGNAIGFSFPLPYVPLATGIRYDFVDPPEVASREMFGASRNYQWLTWALALGNQQAAVGFSLQRSYSDTPAAHGFTTWSSSIALRPSDYLALGGVAHNIDGPVSDGGVKLDPSYVISGGIRPLGTDFLELGIEGEYIDDDEGYWIPKAIVDVGIPHLGRLRGDVAWSDPGSNVREEAWLANASLVLFGNSPQASMELTGGTRFGDGLGSESSDRLAQNINAEVAIRAFRENTGAEGVQYAVRIRIEDTPDPRDHVARLRRLWEIAEEEPNIRAVVFEIRTSPAESLAHVQELQDAIYYLRQRGKKVLCHLEDGSGSALYLCSAADRILVNPAGGVRFAGLSSRYLYFRELLSKLGIRADFIRIGKHKSAPEAFVRDGSTDTSRDDKIDLLQQVEMELTWSLSRGRDMTPEDVRKAIASGPFVALEAKRAGFVDGFAFDDMLDEEVSKLSGAALELRDDNLGVRRPERFGPQRSVAVIYVDGDMVDGRSQTYPFIGIKTVGSYTIADSLKEARDNPLVGAVVLRIETGGGSAMAADVIWREVQLTAAVKPVVVSMGRAAASGGYYIASPATRILANPLTITGSIGVFYGKADVSELLRNIGVNVETYKTAPRADAESLFRPFTPAEKKELKRKVAQFYSMFLRRVADGRNMTKEEVDAVGRGRVWTGRQAQAHQLVDELGGMRQALQQARALAGMRHDTPILELPPPQTTLLGRILGIEGVHEKSVWTEVVLPPALVEMAKALAPFAIHPPDRPLALLELTSVEQP